MHVHPLHRTADPQAVPANGAGTEPATARSAAVPMVSRGPLARPARFAATASMLTGLWVAISPWFLTLQASRGGNATANNLIVGLVVLVLGLLVISGAGSMDSLRAAGLLAGIWLIISPFILDAKVSITASMYWSNIWSGAIIIVAALAMLAMSQARTAH